LEAIFFFGMTQREVAEFLNIPLGTVKSRLRIGLKELGTIYQFKQ
ncbi:MAG: winged helix-turn-helix transcriptional regulator, partial [Flavobacteriaceae bacterium]|nr:winged helix-turn-helix transcriptional regulator [Flavobacteriaceae bacterium]